MESFKLRAWTKTDIPVLAKYLNNKKIWDNCRDALPYPYTEKDAGQFISFVEGQSEQNNYCIEINHEAAGNISFTRGTDVERYNAELGYWLAEPYWNQGIMSEAIKQAIEDYLIHSDAVRIYAHVYGRFSKKPASTSAASSGKAASRTASLLIAIVMNYLKDKLAKCHKEGFSPLFLTCQQITGKLKIK